MKRMAASNVLIVGMNGLGVEIGEWLCVFLDVLPTQAHL